MKEVLEMNNEENNMILNKITGLIIHTHNNIHNIHIIKTGKLHYTKPCKYAYTFNLLGFEISE